MVFFLFLLSSVSVLSAAANHLSDLNICHVRIPFDVTIFEDNDCQAYRFTLDEPESDTVDNNKMPTIMQGIPLKFAFGNGTLDPPHLLLTYSVLKLPQTRRECAKMELKFLGNNLASVALLQASCLDVDDELTNITYVVPPAHLAILKIRNLYYGGYLNNSLEFVIIPTWQHRCPPGLFGSTCIISNLRSTACVDDLDGSNYCLLRNKVINCSNTTDPLSFRLLLFTVIGVAIVMSLFVVWTLPLVLYRRCIKTSTRLPKNVKKNQFVASELFKRETQ